MNSGGGGPPARRANCSGPSSSGRTSGRSLPSDACAAHEPLVGLLEVRHRVRVGALDAVLAADHAVEAERRVVGGEPDADHRPAGPQQLEAERAGGLRADGVERPGRARPRPWPPRASRRRRGRRARRRARGARPAARSRRRAGCRPAARPAASRARSCPRRARPRSRRPVGARRTAWTPLASGSISAPTRAETPSGSTRASAARTLTRPANAPGTWTPTSTRSLHRFVKPGHAQPALAAAGERVHRHPRAVELATRRRRSRRRSRRTRGPSPAAAIRLPMWPR